MSRVLAVRSAFPANKYPQTAVARAVADLAAAAGGLTPARRRLLDRLQANAGVRTRHTILPIEEYAALDGAALSGHDRYLPAATALGEQALGAALAAAGLTARDLDLLIVTSVTGVAVPSLDARLIPRLGLRPDIKRLPVFGLGCLAGAAGLARLHDYLLGWPGQAAALLAVELCSLTVPRTSVTAADAVASALFGDGAGAVVAAGDSRGGPARKGNRQALPQPQPQQQPQQEQQPQPRIVATYSEVYPDSTDTLGWRLGADGFRIVLTAELADVVERRLAGSVSAFLGAHGLVVDDIKTWICHPGGPKVLDAVQRALKLPDAALATSRRSLAEAGNMSSVSVLHILEMTLDAGPPEPHSFGLMIGLGPGVSAELLLLRW
jgi:alkylresorcinol/alkylpyrone synthase